MVWLIPADRVHSTEDRWREDLLAARRIGTASGSRVCGFVRPDLTGHTISAGDYRINQHLSADERYVVRFGGLSPARGCGLQVPVFGDKGSRPTSERIGRQSNIGRRRLGDIWHVDELSVTIRGQRHYLWRAVDHDGDVLDILVTRHRDRKAAKRFFRKALKHQGRSPLQLVTDKLRSYSAAHREVFPSVTHRTGQYENNRAEVSHQHTREQERQMRRFKSAAQVQRFLSSTARFTTCSELAVII